MDIDRLPIRERVLGPILRRAADTGGDRPYLTIAGHRYSFRDTEGRVRAIARGLAALGIAKGDRVALMLPNCAEFIFTWYACCLRGAAMVPINPTYKGYMLEAVLADAGCRGLVIDRSLVAALQTAAEEHRRALQWVAVVGGRQRLDLPTGPCEYLAFDELIQEAGAEPELACDFRDIQSVMYTSGTTGPSKGVLISNAHFFSSACVFLRALAFGPDDVLFTPLPLFHGLASRLGVLPALMVGAHAVVGDRFSGSRFWQQVCEAEATVAHTLFTIPPLLKTQMAGPYDRAHRLRAMYNAHHDQEFEERFNVRLVEAYGLTETGLCVYTPYPERRYGAAGRPHEDFEIRIVDDMDFELPPGRTGEIVVRPKRPFIMMQGYLNKPAETLEAWRNLWFHTGDVARMDEDGYLYFVDRKKERIRRRGENVSSYDVEQGVMAHPAVAACAAVPHPAEAGEDDIRILVILHAGETLTAPALMDWLVGRLPAFMLPRYIEFVDDLPRSPTAKVEKYKLAEQGLGTAVWDREASGYRLAPSADARRT